MEGGKTRAKRRRTPTGAYSGKTKFDKWVEKCASDHSLCEIVLSPPAPYSYSDKNPDNCRFMVTFMEIDRYMVRVVFDDHEHEDDGGNWWIAKDAIRAASKVS